MKSSVRFFFIISCLIIIFSDISLAQSFNPDTVRDMIQEFKEDRQGPFQGIRWFCKDGTVNPAKQPCKDGGNQHGLHKNSVQRLAQEHGIYLAQILAGNSSFTDFWDSGNQNSRVKQFILEKYLQGADDGWIFRRAQYYRGAVQMEDEEEWGLDFLKWLVSKDEVLESQFFLMRQAVKEIPHRAAGNRWNAIRAKSKNIAEIFPLFEKFRIKLHGRPEAGDIEKIRIFQKKNQEKISPGLNKMIQDLLNELETAFSPSYIILLRYYVPKLPDSLPIKEQLRQLIISCGSPLETGPDLQILRCRETADLLLNIRKSLLSVKSSRTRLILMDLSDDLEAVLFRDAAAWQPKTLRGFLNKSHVLSKAAAGCGFLELWEWEIIEPLLSVSPESERLAFENFIEKSEYARRISEWGTGMVRAVYGPEINMFSAFEPLSKGFEDERIRSSCLLSLGELAGQLADIAAELSGTSNNVMGIRDQNRIRGLNPGFTKAELEVITGNVEAVSFSDEKIYVLPHVPFDIKPVAGIAAVSEGNLVSHVQLLARNLGIPNAVIAPHHFEQLAEFSGRTMFYAVSPRGAVIMKPADEMTVQESELVETQSNSREKIMVPLEKLNLEEQNLLSLKNLRSFDSGRVCGPKAANLGQLKSMFPDYVVDGLVIPFGVFRQHMNQSMSGTGMSYWQFLQDTFTQAHADRESGKFEEDIDAEVLTRLARFRKEVLNISFLPDFKNRLRQGFNNEFGVNMGALPVFIRSDTNMEDLKDFTGSGLNKTVFNVRDADDIWQGIREVWASPFRERGYRWRQKFLLNPENVYPSILILPSVNVDKSGVLITTGVSSRNPGDITAAFSKGAGGAVEGQKAETWLLKTDGSFKFLSPSREPEYNVLPKSGGTEKGCKYFHERLLNKPELEKLLSFALEIRTLLPGAPGIESEGPFDVELGFLGEKLWLFQVRPYVENKQAGASAYLQALDPEMPKNIRILLDEDDEKKISETFTISEEDIIKPVPVEPESVRESQPDLQ